MMRELFVTIYLFCFRIAFAICKMFPIQKKITFIDSFADNIVAVHREMHRQGLEAKLILLHSSRCKYDVHDMTDCTKIVFGGYNPLRFVRAVYHIATARELIIDNYQPFLAVVRFKVGVECIQLWHAAGAIKTFASRDHSFSSRSERAQQRFLSVYRQFHKIVVGSDAMASIFAEAFQVPPDRMLKTGVPRTDIFYDETYRSETVERLIADNPSLKFKRVILYVPTFRDGELQEPKLQLDISQLRERLAEDYVLLLRLHPAVRTETDYEQLYKGFVFDYSSYGQVNDLLFLTDYLITDYSSIVYEYALLKKPMIFYPYDLTTYQRERGLWGPYESLVTGPIVYTTEEIVDVILRNKFDVTKIECFSREWNEYCQGTACVQLVQYLQSRFTGQPAASTSTMDLT